MKSPQPSLKHPGMELFTSLNERLESTDEWIEYDTLMQIYQTMINAPYEIYHMDRLLTSLINKRNANPRVDQMILILSARVLGQSSHPIPDVYAIFESILTKDDRLSNWVLAFVAEAIANYGEVIPAGDKLVDLAEKQTAMLASTVSRKEYFGFHFLPPPKGSYIRSYISGIQKRSERETERNHYYFLISAGYAESDIEAALRRLRSVGSPAVASTGKGYLKYLSHNRDQIHQR